MMDAFIYMQLAWIGFLLCFVNDYLKRITEVLEGEEDEE